MRKKQHLYSALSCESGAQGMDNLMEELSAQVWESPEIKKER